MNAMGNGIEFQTKTTTISEKCICVSQMPNKVYVTSLGFFTLKLLALGQKPGIHLPNSVPQLQKSIFLFTVHFDLQDVIGVLEKAGQGKPEISTLAFTDNKLGNTMYMSGASIFQLSKNASTLGTFIDTRTRK